jgi:hypothetical protein
MTKFFLIVFTIWVIFRLFGKQIMAFLMLLLAKKVAKHAAQQNAEFQRNYGQSPYGETTYSYGNTQVVEPPAAAPRKSPKSLADIAEDVPFEEKK